MCNHCGKGPCIPVEVLKKLPIGGQFIGFCKELVTTPVSETEFKKEWVTSIIWEWTDVNLGQPLKRRIARFHKDTGEYLGEHK